MKLQNIYDWDYELSGDIYAIQDEDIEKLRNLNYDIYHNDLEGRYWVFDEKLSNVWVEARYVNPTEKIIKFHVCDSIKC